MQLVFGREPSISHLKIFGCAVYVPIAPPQRTKMGLQRRLGIYVGYESPSIIKYLEPMTGDLFTARFVDCYFNETVFPALGGEKVDPRKKEIEIIWNATQLSMFDPRTNICEQEVKKIVHLQSVANQLPDAFIDTKKVTKSHIPAENAPARIEIPSGDKTIENESIARRKRGRPVGSKDSKPRKVKRSDGIENEFNNIPPTEGQDKDENPKGDEHDDHAIDNNEISMNYFSTKNNWNRNDVIINEIFAYSIAIEMVSDENDSEPRTVEECRCRHDWPKWKEAMQTELKSLEKREVFGKICLTPMGVKPVGYKWVFVRKRNEKNEIVRYKARLVAQGFSQIPGIDYEETYSPVVDATTLRFLVSLTVSEGLKMRLMDVVTAYLYGSLDTDIYMKVPDGLKLPENHKPRQLLSIKLKRSLYGLKQSGRMWYNRLSEYLMKEGFKNNQISPCVFIKRSQSGFAIIAVYVDDLNIIGTSNELEKTAKYLMKEFEMKDLGQTKFCLGLQIEHLSNGIFVHQSNYIERVLKRFFMDKAHPIGTPMVVRSLNMKNDPFRPREENEEVLGPEVPYLSAIGALMYLANNTRPDIAFSVNLLARYSNSPTQRHWKGIKQLFRYLRGTQDLGLFYQPRQDATLTGYADAGYLSDPLNAKSQTGYLFTYGGTAISWKSTKQTLTATSSNHAELIALYEAGRECVWLRSMIDNIQGECGMKRVTENPTIIYEDNSACISQVTEGYIKGDRTKHLSPKLFFTHDLQKEGKIDVQQIQSCENLADLFTKSLPSTSFHKLVHKIGMRRLCEIR